MSLDLPSFSIIIPTNDRLIRLAVCLTAVVQVDYPQERFELIAVEADHPQKFFTSW